MKVFNNDNDPNFLFNILQESELNRVVCNVLYSSASSFKVGYKGEVYWVNKNYTSFHPDAEGNITADIRYFQQYN